MAQTKSFKGLVVVSPGTNMEFGPSVREPIEWASELEHELGDPIGYFMRDASGKVTSVMHTGTGNKFMESPSIRGLASGSEPFRVRKLDIWYNGRTLSGNRLAWDLTLVDMPKAGGGTERFGYAGIMTHTAEIADPQFPRDNYLREIHALVQKDDRLIDLGPLMPRKIDPKNIWIGHCYGPKFVTVSNGKTYIVYEKVVEQVTVNGVQTPRRTELFRREMLSPTKVSPVETRVLAVNPPKGQTAYPSTVRSDGGQLIEGIIITPKKVKIEGPKGTARELRLATWSAGDFDGAYGAFVGEWRNGKVIPLLTAKGDDFENILGSISNKYKLRGAGRLSFVTDENNEILKNSDGTVAVRFHAYLNKENVRRIFFAKAKLVVNAAGRLEVTVLDEINDAKAPQ